MEPTFLVGEHETLSAPEQSPFMGLSSGTMNIYSVCTIGWVRSVPRLLGESGQRGMTHMGDSSCECSVRWGACGEHTGGRRTQPWRGWKGFLEDVICKLILEDGPFTQNVLSASFKCIFSFSYLT